MRDNSSKAFEVTSLCRQDFIMLLVIVFSESSPALLSSTYITRENYCSLLLYSLIAFYISVFKGMYFFSSALLCLHPATLSIFYRAQNCLHSYKNASAIWDLLRVN